MVMNNVRDAIMAGYDHVRQHGGKVEYTAMVSATTFGGSAYDADLKLVVKSYAVGDNVIRIDVVTK